MSTLVFEKQLPRGTFQIYNSVPNLPFVKVAQSHSDIVLDENSCHEKNADGIVGNQTTPKAILTADCLPVVLLGEKGLHAFIHAGWRGLHNQILHHPLIQEIKPFYAFVGPHICVDHYEVQSEFKSYFLEERAFKIGEGKYYFNMAVMIDIQLKKFYPDIEIEISDKCTFSEPSLHSFRQNKTTERNWNIYLP